MTSSQRALIVIAVLVVWIAGVRVGRATAAPVVVDGVVVDVEVVCANVDDSGLRPAREPLVTFWSGSAYDGDWQDTPGLWDIYIPVWDYVTGEPIGALEMTGLTTPGHHDNWFGDPGTIDGRTIAATVIVNGVTVDTDVEYCPLPVVAPPVIVDPAPTPQPAVSPATAVLVRVVAPLLPRPV